MVTGLSNTAADVVRRHDIRRLPEGSRRISFRWFDVVFSSVCWIAAVVGFMPYWGLVPEPVFVLVVGQASLLLYVVYPVLGPVFCLFRRSWPSASVSLSQNEIGRDFFVVMLLLGICWQVWISVGFDLLALLVVAIFVAAIVLRLTMYYWKSPAARRHIYLIDILSALYLVFVAIPKSIARFGL